MPTVADVARDLTDATLVHMSAIVPLITGAVVVLSGAVAWCVAWLCYAELRSRRTHHLLARRLRHH
jgi:hypothetical protein